MAEVYPAYVEYARAILAALPPEHQRQTALRPEVLQSYRMPR